MTSVRGVEITGAFWFDVIIRIILALSFLELEKAEPFARKIHVEELWLYKNPITTSYVPTTVLWPLVFLVPTFVICITFIITKDRVDFCQALMAVTLTLGLNGVLTDMIKIIVGRPRPDYFWRCFPNGEMNSELECTGDPSNIKEGRKSFPSGHSSFAFASLSFVSLYLAGKLHTFALSGKGQAWKLLIFLFPLCIAIAIALSRTCDYHHHWQDVTIGSLIGLCLSYLCYRHYYPSLDSHVCHKPYINLTAQVQLEYVKASKEEQIKWI
ncbi:phospholipid phosphatase 5 isoform X1 [Cephus cinctus]|uniref:Phospholipid phosphatase 5 isoform X1 n=1 Tax=Cephus cinctus TaxID=211228 RepID=A0AAJ7FCX7_CEPCN|nr:phospholipid phosphatase 5 isoform X1 [Cephus cinctus]